MGAMVAPLPEANLAAWESWIGELNGSRKAEFDDMNQRHSITDHRAYLQATPDGGHVVVVITDGAGGDSLVPTLAASDNEFDKWFIKNVFELHGVDPSSPPPPAAERRL